MTKHLGIPIVDSASAEGLHCAGNDVFCAAKRSIFLAGPRELDGTKRVLSSPLRFKGYGSLMNAYQLNG